MSIDAMPASVTRSGGLNLALHYDRYETPLGDLVLAASSYGLSHASFENGQQAMARLLRDYPKADIIRKHDPHHMAALRYFDADAPATPLKLVLKGTPFQRAVWRALLDIAPGTTSTYQAIAQAIGKPTASRAVGGAVGRNPVSFLFRAIACWPAMVALAGIIGGWIKSANYWLGKAQAFPPAADKPGA